MAGLDAIGTASVGVQSSVFEEPNELDHVHTIEQVPYTYVVQVSPNDLNHTHTIESVDYTYVLLVTPDDLSHGHTIDEVGASMLHSASPEDLDHVHTIGPVTFSAVSKVLALDQAIDPDTEDSPEVGDLFQFGIQGQESLEMLIRKIEPIQDLGARLHLVEYAPGVFDADSGTIPDHDSQITLPPTQQAPTITDIRSDDQVMEENTEGVLVPTIQVTLSVDPEKDGRAIQMEIKRSDSDVWTKVPSKDIDDRHIDINPVSPGVEYDIRVRAIRDIGLPTAWNEDSHTVDGQIQTPDPPTNVSAIEKVSKTIQITYDLPENRKINRAGIWKKGPGATSFQQIDITQDEQYIDNDVRLGSTYTYAVSSVDAALNESALVEADPITVVLASEEGTETVDETDTGTNQVLFEHEYESASGGAGGSAVVNGEQLVANFAGWLRESEDEIHRFEDRSLNAYDGSMDFYEIEGEGNVPFGAAEGAWILERQDLWFPTVQNLYEESAGESNWVNGYSEHDGNDASSNISKEVDHLFILCQTSSPFNNTSSTAQRTWVSDQTYNLNNFNVVEVEWSARIQSADFNNDKKIALVVDHNKFGSMGNFQARLLHSGSTFNRRSETLDVSGLSGHQYIRLHGESVTRPLTPGTEEAELKTYRVFIHTGNEERRYLSSTSGLAVYPSPGDKFGASMRLTSDGDDDSREASFLWATQTEDPNQFDEETGPLGYAINLRNDSTGVELVLLESGNETVLDSDSGFQPNLDEWYDVIIDDWAENGDITAEIYDGNDVLQTTLTANDTTWTSGGIGMASVCADENGSRRSHEYWDDIRLFNPEGIIGMEYSVISLGSVSGGQSSMAVHWNVSGNISV